MEIYDLNINDTVTFETELGERRENRKYIGSVTWDIAITLGLDVVSRHTQYAIEIGETGPSDYKDYQFAIFRTPEGDREIYGHPWIKANSIVQKSTVSYQMTIPSATEQQLSSLRSMAVAIGLIGFKIEPL